MLTKEQWRKRRQRITYAKLAAILILGVAIVTVLLLIIFG